VLHKKILKVALYFRILVVHVVNKVCGLWPSVCGSSDGIIKTFLISKLLQPTRNLHCKLIIEHILKSKRISFLNYIKIYLSQIFHYFVSRRCPK